MWCSQYVTPKCMTLGQVPYIRVLRTSQWLMYACSHEGPGAGGALVRPSEAGWNTRALLPGPRKRNLLSYRWFHSCLYRSEVVLLCMFAHSHAFTSKNKNMNKIIQSTPGNWKHTLQDWKQAEFYYSWCTRLDGVFLRSDHCSYCLRQASLARARGCAWFFSQLVCFIETQSSHISK